jgi:heptosyltransferase-1
MPARPPLSEFEPRRIVLIKPSALGDVIHALPVLSALRRRFPRAHIAWVVNRVYEPLLLGHPDLSSTLPFDRTSTSSGWLATAARFAGFARRLRAGRFDLAIDLQGLLRSGLMTLATGAARKVGLADAREGARWCYTDLISPGPGKQHAVDRYWSIAEALGAGGGRKNFRVPIQPASSAWAERRLRDFPRPHLVLGVSSRWPTKRWLPEHFGALAARAQKEFGGTVLFIGVREEAELSAAAAARLHGPVLDLTGKTTLPHLVALLAKADAMLANDTGPLHLAVALGRPVVAPYTCTEAARTGPYGMSHRAVETRVGCAGSCLKRCSRMECMSELTPERLWPVLREVLESCRRPSLGLVHSA